jgi:putative GTP pyrophosphokinase
VDPKEVAKEYREHKYNLYSEFASRIRSLVCEIAGSLTIEIAHSECRAKSPDSFLKKIEVKGFSNPFNEVKDLAGVRVITYYPDDAARLAAELASQFKIDSEHSSDKLSDLEADTFGYRSIHLIVTLSEPRRSLPEWKAFKALQTEIQIRSVLQHAWASISHKLDYKVAQQAPVDLRRQLFRLSAILELADELFSKLRDESRKMSETYKESVDKGNLGIPLNLDSLKAYIIERGDLTKWYRLGLQVGMRDHSLGASVIGNEQELGRLCATAQHAKISNINELDDLIRAIESRAKGYLQELSIAAKKEGTAFRAIAIDMLTVLIMVARKEHFQKELPFEPKFTAPLEEIIRKLVTVSGGVTH